MAYTVSDPHNPSNYIVYVADQYLGNYILSIDDDIDECAEDFTEGNKT